MFAQRIAASALYEPKSHCQHLPVPVSTFLIELFQILSGDFHIDSDSLDFA
jgi:hypothetical protein